MSNHTFTRYSANKKISVKIKKKKKINRIAQYILLLFTIRLPMQTGTVV